ncbi:MAG: YdeI/OmpD-associated family protein [Actinomycetota bacterium]|nr:YdeI/OmpD-associated family protein [Actinomycetota bacterium]
MAPQRFETVLRPTGKTVTVIDIPFDVPATFGARRVPVRGTVNGVEFRTTLMPMHGEYCMIVNRHLRARAGIAAGETIRVELERDDEPRSLDPPDDLREALARDPEAWRFFDGLSYTHRKEYVEWIDEAKRDETRRRRIDQAVAMLRDAKKQR